MSGPTRHRAFLHCGQAAKQQITVLFPTDKSSNLEIYTVVKSLSMNLEQRAYKHDRQGQEGVHGACGLDSSEESHEAFHKLDYTRIFRVGAT